MSIRPVCTLQNADALFQRRTASGLPSVDSWPRESNHNHGEKRYGHHILRKWGSS
jgi:hypothetical protein